MASLAVDLVKGLDSECIVVLDAYFSVGPVFLVLKEAARMTGQRLAHVITRAKSNVVAYEDPPPKTGRPGAPRKYGPKLKLSNLFAQRLDSFQKATIDIYGNNKTTLFSLPRPAVEANKGEGTLCSRYRRQ
jgi:hypothetical protein